MKTSFFDFSGFRLESTPPLFPAPPVRPVDFLKGQTGIKPIHICLEAVPRPLRRAQPSFFCLFFIL